MPIRFASSALIPQGGRDAGLIVWVLVDLASGKSVRSVKVVATSLDFGNPSNENLWTIQTRPPDGQRSGSMGSDLIEAWAAGWSAHDPERLVAVFREDCVYEDIPLGIVSRGREDLREFIRDWLRSSPDIVMRLQNTINTGAHAGAEWTFSGTQEGELADIAPTGRRFELRGASFFELDSEGISRCCDYWDLADLQRQLGQ